MSDKIENYRHTEIILTKCRIRRSRLLKLNFKGFDIGSGTNKLLDISKFIYFYLWVVLR